MPRFRLGIYVYPDAEVAEYTAAYAVLAAAGQCDPGFEVFLLADTLQPIATQAGLVVHPEVGLSDQPELDALLIPGGISAQKLSINPFLQYFVESLPSRCQLASVGNGCWVYARMGLLEGKAAAAPVRSLPNLSSHCRVSGARVVDAGRLITAAGGASAMELGFHLLRRAGRDEPFIAKVARSLEYSQAYAGYRWDIEYDAGAAPLVDSPLVDSHLEDSHLETLPGEHNDLQQVPSV